MTTSPPPRSGGWHPTRCCASGTDFHAIPGDDTVMRVTFDDQIFTGQQIGGAARYFTELLQEFRRNPTHGVEPVTPFRYVITEHLVDSDPARFRTPRRAGIARRGAALRTLNAVRSGSRLRKADVIHHTYYLPSYLHIPAASRICTVYDMIPELLPELYPNGSPHYAKEKYVQACDAVICISQTTKADLLRLYGALDKPVEVTPLAVADAYYRARAKDDAGYPYLAYIGRREQYKNFDVVLRAFARIAGEHSDLRLLCAGGGPFRDGETARIEELGLSSRVERRTIPDEEMPSLYASAIGMVFPSRYEGFGLPIVEAFAARCPVVVADTPCSIEVSAGAAQVFAPDDEEQLATILSRLAGDPAERARWAAQGLARARDFSWTRTAVLTAAVYRRIGRAR
jgi:glycosyltransferase involved in cell wall biosynthesis